MKNLILIFLLLLLVGGGGFAAYHFLFRTGDEPGEKTAEAVESTAAFVSFGTVNLPVIRHGNIYRYIGVTITLEVAGAEQADIVKRQLSKLNDEFVREGLRRARLWDNTDYEPTLRDIKAMLRDTANGVLGEGVVRAVLIQNVREWAAS